MDTSLDLTTAPREALLAVIDQLQRRIETLEGEAKPGGPKGMPGIKPKSGRQQTPREKGPREKGPRKKGPRKKGPREKGPRKPRPHGFARLRMTPTHRVEHALESCPECGTGLAGGWGQRTREIIDLPLVPVQVTEHVFIARICPVCEKRRVPKSDLGGAALGKQRLGVNLLSLIAALPSIVCLNWHRRQSPAILGPPARAAVSGVGGFGIPEQGEKGGNGQKRS